MRLLDSVETQLVAGGGFLASDGFDEGHQGGYSAGGALVKIAEVFATLSQAVAFINALVSSPTIQAVCNITVSNSTGSTVYTANCVISVNPPPPTP